MVTILVGKCNVSLTFELEWQQTEVVCLIDILIVFKCNLSNSLKSLLKKSFVFIVHKLYLNFLIKKQYGVEETCKWEGYSLFYTGRVVLIVSYQPYFQLSYLLNTPLGIWVYLFFNNNNNKIKSFIAFTKWKYLNLHYLYVS